MADLPTKLADMIVPEIFNDYVVQRTTEKARLFQSGIVADLTSEINEQIAGKTVNMPFFNDLSGADEVVDDTVDLSIAGVDTDKDVAVKLYRARVYGGTDLAADLAGADPIDVIVSRFADFWERRFQAALLSTLAGALGAANMTQNTLDISALTGGAEFFDGDSFIDATHRLGDEAGSLSGVAVHSDTLKAMKKADLIDYIRPSDGGEDIPVYMGKAVLVDDGMPKNVDVYTTYIFGQGAIGYGEKSPKVPVELGREPLKGGGQDYIVNRRQFVLHPRGVKWVGTPVGPTPTNAELATVGNWTRVYDPKVIRIVAFKHKVA